MILCNFSFGKIVWVLEFYNVRPQKSSKPTGKYNKNVVTEYSYQTQTIESTECQVYNIWDLGNEGREWSDPLIVKMIRNKLINNQIL